MIIWCCTRSQDRKRSIYVHTWICLYNNWCDVTRIHMTTCITKRSKYAKQTEHTSKLYYYYYNIINNIVRAWHHLICMSVFFIGYFSIQFVVVALLLVCTFQSWLRLGVTNHFVSLLIIRRLSPTIRQYVPCLFIAIRVQHLLSLSTCVEC